MGQGAAAAATLPAGHAAGRSTFDTKAPANEPRLIPPWQQFSNRLQGAMALSSDAANPEDVPSSPWQAPPAFLTQALVSALNQEARWGLCIGPLRLVSRGWCAAVGDALPLLSLRPHVPVDEAAAAVSRFPGLRLLRIQSPGGVPATGCVGGPWALCVPAPPPGGGGGRGGDTLPGKKCGGGVPRRGQRLGCGSAGSTRACLKWPS